MAAYRGKRALDLAICLPALLVSLPVQVVVGAVVALKLGRPVLFRQLRPGLQGEPFELIKFRTMLPIDFGKGQTDDASRMNPTGRILRATSLDELPSLWNIVRGDMSVVGPRPLLMQYLERYSPEQARRHDVRPGLTGLAQVSGRNALSWEQKLALDVEYVDNVSVSRRSQNPCDDRRLCAGRQGCNWCRGADQVRVHGKYCEPGRGGMTRRVVIIGCGGFGREVFSKYADNASLLGGDLRILVMTVAFVLAGKGVTGIGETTKSEFMGSTAIEVAAA